MSRRLVAMTAAVLSSTAALAVVAPAPSQAAAGDPFPAGPGLVFVAQNINTRLYKAVQGADDISFSPEGPASGGRYNATAFNVADMYIYAMRDPDSANLLRVGQNGVVTPLGAVSGLPVLDYNQGTFGDDGLMYVRDSQTSTRLFRFDVNARVATSVPLSSAVPNLSDFTSRTGSSGACSRARRCTASTPPPARSTRSRSPG